MAYEFFVVMRKRRDGTLSADLNKTDERMYLLEEDAINALANMGRLAEHFHVIALVAELKPDWERLVVAAEVTLPATQSRLATIVSEFNPGELNLEAPSRLSTHQRHVQRSGQLIAEER